LAWSKKLLVFHQIWYFVSLNLDVCAWPCSFFSYFFDIINFNSRLSILFTFVSIMDLVVSIWKTYIFNSCFFTLTFITFISSFFSCTYILFLWLLQKPSFPTLLNLLHTRHHIYNPQTLIIAKEKKYKQCARKLMHHKKTSLVLKFLTSKVENFP
jgi:hypothetical protein